MTHPAPPPPPWSAQPGPPVPPPALDAPQSIVAVERSIQLRAAVLLVGVLGIVGAILGVIWQAWSPPGPAGLKLPAGVQADETEAFVAGDGRFVLMGAIVGLLAGLASWYVPRLRAARGPYVALGLAVGGLFGSALMELVGWLIRGQGSTYTCGGGSLRCINHIPLTVHMHALLFIESVVALLVYVLFVAFAVHDDLGRPDPNAKPAPQPVPAMAGQVPYGMPAGPNSVGPQSDLQHPWPHGNGPGASQ